MANLLDMDTQVEHETGERFLSPGSDLCLTIARHPDPGRLGHLLRVGSVARQRDAALEISRTAPLFEDAFGGDSGPLTHPLISRTPHMALRRASSGWVVEALGDIPLHIGSDACRSATLSANDLAAGVMIHANDYVSFHAHLGPQRPPDRAERRLELTGDSQKMRSVRQLILRYGPDPAPVLVSGETGTGKELVVRALHREAVLSGRADRMGILNCAAIPENLFESELFGHVKGAFTGADKHDGVMRRAHGGTLFLDEVQELPLSQQSKLLRALESGEIRPVGSDRPAQVDVRLVCCTNVDLQARVEDGTFRADLFNRIHGLRIAIPPLNQRRPDIFGLVQLLLRRELRQRNALNLLVSTPRRSLAPPRPVIEALFTTDYTRKNVRQLITYARAVAAGSRAIGRLTWPPVPSASRASSSGTSSLEEEFERCGRSVSKMARAHGVKTEAMNARLRRSGVIVPPGDISATELAAAVEACQGDALAVARRLRLPDISAKRLMTQLRKDPTSS